MKILSQGHPRVDKGEIKPTSVTQTHTHTHTSSHVSADEVTSVFCAFGLHCILGIENQTHDLPVASVLLYYFSHSS